MERLFTWKDVYDTHKGQVQKRILGSRRWVCSTWEDIHKGVPGRDPSLNEAGEPLVTMKSSKWGLVNYPWSRARHPQRSKKEEEETVSVVITRV